MTFQTLLLAILSVQAIILLFDLVEEYKSFLEKGAFPSRRSIIFLIVVIAVYGLIQYTLLALVPRIDELSQRAQSFVREIVPIAAGQKEGSIPLFFVIGICVFYIAGLMDYLTHRFLHLPKMFFLHEYHHLPNKIFIALPGYSVRPFTVFAAIPPMLATLFLTHLTLSLFGYQTVDIIPVIFCVVFLQTSILVMTHSSVMLRQKWLHAPLKAIGITTPQDHSLHHTVDLRGNFGNYTTYWDRLFGTYLDPLAPENIGHSYGLDYDSDYLGAITAGKLKIPANLRSYFEVDRYVNLETPPADKGATG